MNAIDRRREAFIDEMFMYAMLVVVIGIAALFFMWDHGRTASANARNGCETAGQWVVCDGVRLKASEVEGVVSMEQNTVKQYVVKVRVDGGIVEVMVGVGRIDEALKLLDGAR